MYKLFRNSMDSTVSWSLLNTHFYIVRTRKNRGFASRRTLSRVHPSGDEKIKPAKNFAGSQKAFGISLTWRLLNSHLKWCRTWWARITLDIVHWTVHYKRLCFIMFSFYPFDKKNLYNEFKQKTTRWMWKRRILMSSCVDCWKALFCSRWELIVLG